MNASVCRVAVASTLAVLTLCAPRASAERPAVWDVARDPRAASEQAALRQAQRLFVQARVAGLLSPAGVLLLSDARRILERAGAADSRDPRIIVFYGRVLEMLGDDAAAVSVLEPAARDGLPPQHAAEAFFALAVSYARLRRPHDEIRAYAAFLEVETSIELRTIALSNQAEGFMVIGHLARSIRGYREAIALAHDNALAHWGLAVALDRWGDHAGALAAAKLALTYDRDARQLTGPGVFFVPDYDRFWYRALGAMSRAESADGPANALLWWERAVLLWQQYLDAAHVDDRWAPIAKSRRARSEHAASETRLHARPRSGRTPAPP